MNKIYFISVNLLFITASLLTARAAEPSVVVEDVTILLEPVALDPHARPEFVRSSPFGEALLIEQQFESAKTWEEAASHLTPEAQSEWKESWTATLGEHQSAIMLFWSFVRFKDEHGGLLAGQFTLAKPNPTVKTPLWDVQKLYKSDQDEVAGYLPIYWRLIDNKWKLATYDKDKNGIQDILINTRRRDLRKKLLATFPSNADVP